MSQGNVAMEHSREIIRQNFGNKLEKMESTEEKTKITNVINKNLEMSVHEVVGGGYDIHIYGKDDILKEHYVISDIAKDEMQNICKSFKDLYEKISSKKSGCCS